MRLVTWNVNHRARPRPVPGWVPEVLQALAPDVLVLTEYVPGPPNGAFRASLASLGLHYIALSPDAPGENRVLVASRSPVVEGNIRPPLIAPSVPSNFIHVRLPDQCLEVVGMRMPDYSKQPPVRRACWDWLEQAAGTLAGRPSVILGDFNADPRYPKSRCGDRFARLEACGWQHALPGGASYWTPRGRGVRIDHAFVSYHVSVRTACYVSKIAGLQLAHRNGPGIPDHAALVLVLERRAALGGRPRPAIK